MHTTLLSLRAVPTGTLADEVMDLIANHHRSVHGIRTSAPGPQPMGIHLANFLVQPGYWMKWQQTIGGLLDFQRQELPPEVVLTSPPVVQKAADQDCWGFHVLDDCLSEMVAGIQDLGLEHREGSGGLPFLSILSGPDLKTADDDLKEAITNLVHSGPLQLKPRAELVTGRVLPTCLRRSLTPYQLPVGALLKACDEDPGPTPQLHVLTRA